MNQAEFVFTRNTAIQAKLEVGRLDDKYEKEANAVADNMMQMPDPNYFQMQADDNAPHISMKCDNSSGLSVALRPKNEDSGHIQLFDMFSPTAARIDKSR